jgi:hypothetical protein
MPRGDPSAADPYPHMEPEFDNDGQPGAFNYNRAPHGPIFNFNPEKNPNEQLLSMSNRDSTGTDLTKANVPEAAADGGGVADQIQWIRPDGEDHHCKMLFRYFGDLTQRQEIEADDGYDPKTGVTKSNPIRFQDRWQVIVEWRFFRTCPKVPGFGCIAHTNDPVHNVLNPKLCPANIKAF